MNPLAVTLKPIRHGWGATLSDGRELARFTGPAAKFRALRYLKRGVIRGKGVDVC
jgi:hypothetical protein